MPQAQIMLGRMLEQVQAGRRPHSRALVKELLSRYLEVAELEPSTRITYEGYIRRTIMPALGAVEVRKVRGLMLDTLYARLRRCSDLACVSGRTFIEHTSFPDLSGTGSGRFERWQRIAKVLRDAIISGELAPGSELPSIRDLATRYELPFAAVRHAVKSLAAEGLVVATPGRPAIVRGAPHVSHSPPRPSRADPTHDCSKAGCRPHTCNPMSASTIRQIHSILSGAFAAAVRWEWIDRNPASSARLPKLRPRAPASPEPAAVAKVIAAAREVDLEQIALYLWLAAVTGARRGELCGLQWIDVEFERRILHIASSYLVRSGLKVCKDTKTHQDRYLALDEITVSVLADRLEVARHRLALIGVEFSLTSFVFSNDPLGQQPWNPDWVTHTVAHVAERASVKLNIKALRHYSASQLLAGGIDLRNTAARLGHSDGGATTLRHYADPVSAVDRKAAAYLAELTSGPTKTAG